jgi:hypothetical protein
MSKPDPKIQSNTRSSPTSPIMLTGKAPAAAPKLTDDDNNVEMKSIASGHEMQSNDDIMQLARLGDIAGFQKLFDLEKFNPEYCDAEGITPLHVGTAKITTVLPSDK